MLLQLGEDDREEQEYRRQTLLSIDDIKNCRRAFFIGFGLGRLECHNGSHIVGIDALVRNKSVYILYQVFYLLFLPRISALIVRDAIHAIRQQLREILLCIVTHVLSSLYKYFFAVLRATFNASAALERFCPYLS